MEHRNILIVDDDAEFTGSLREILEARDYKVLAAVDRRHAEAVALTMQPDLVVLGTVMPRGSAFLFHQWLKHMPRFSDIPIMVVNAPWEEMYLRGWLREEGMRCEAEDFVEKPIDAGMLLPRIEKLMDRVTRRIKVLVADDHAMVRDGIRAVLAIQHDMQVVGEAMNGKDALDKTLELSPDVVLMDIVMPVMGGLDATRQIHKKCPLVRVLILTQYDDEENILASNQAGALGFIPKTAASSMLLDGIRAVTTGRSFVYRSAN